MISYNATNKVHVVSNYLHTPVYFSASPRCFPAAVAMDPTDDSDRRGAANARPVRTATDPLLTHHQYPAPSAAASRARSGAPLSPTGPSRRRERRPARGGAGTESLGLSVPASRPTEPAKPWAAQTCTTPAAASCRLQSPLPRRRELRGRSKRRRALPPPSARPFPGCCGNGGR